jgi:NADPH:quinone reductase-like Zn-dependent oxidoreductase
MTTSTTTSNKHCVLTGKETVIIEDRPIPTCGPGQVLVHIMATGM